MSETPTATIDCVYLGKVWPLARASGGYGYAWRRTDTDEEIGFTKIKAEYVGAVYTLEQFGEHTWRRGDFVGTTPDSRLPEWQAHERAVEAEMRIRRQRDREKKDAKDIMGELTLEDVRAKIWRLSGMNRTGYLATVIDYITQGRA